MDKLEAVQSTHIPSHIAGNCTPKLLQCPNCVECHPVMCEKLRGAYDWCLSLSCSQCNTFWYACNQCADNPWMRHLMTTARRTQHHKNYHEKKRKLACCTIGLEESNSDDDNIHSCCSEIETNTQQPCNKFSMAVISCSSKPGAHDFKALSNHRCNDFFAHQVIDGVSGVTRLISWSQFGISSMADKLSPRDVSAQLHMSDLVYSLTRKQRTQFADAMKFAVESTEDRM